MCKAYLEDQIFLGTRDGKYKQSVAPFVAAKLCYVPVVPRVGLGQHPITTNYLDLQFQEPHLDFLNQKSWGWSLPSVLTSPPGASHTPSGMRTPASETGHVPWEMWRLQRTGNALCLEGSTQLWAWLSCGNPSVDQKVFP